MTVLRVANDARLEIDYQPFASDFRTTGKTIEIEFATRDVLNYDAVIADWMSGGCGIQITAQKATLKSEQSEIGTQFKENEHVRIAFVVEKKNENRLIYIYINGIMTGATQYPEDDDFSQDTSGANGVIANGGGVCKKKYKLTYNRIAGYGRPDYGVAVETETSVETPVQETVTNGKKQITVTGNTVNIRRGDSTKAASVGRLNNGDTMEWVATAENGWNAGRHGNEIVWISGKYSKVSGG